MQDEVIEVEVDEDGPIEVEEDVTELMQVPSRNPSPGRGLASGKPRRCAPRPLRWCC